MFFDPLIDAVFFIFCEKNTKSYLWGKMISFRRRFNLNFYKINVPMHVKDKDE